MKKTIFFSLCGITSVLLILCMCSTDPVAEKDNSGRINIDTLTFVHSMKGWELYSWRNTDDWSYSILIGTNRTKSYNEVITNKIIITGKDSLKMVLDRFPENEHIHWIGCGWLQRCWGGGYVGNLSLPDEDTVNEIKEYCLLRKLDLSVSE